MTVRHGYLPSFCIYVRTAYSISHLRRVVKTLKWDGFIDFDGDELVNLVL